VDNFFYPSVSIITVNYNGLKYLADLFNSISGLDYPKEKIQTIMVDNCSKDASVDFVKNNYPFVEIIVLPKNTGFAGGNNAGLKAATGEYMALINNDCAVDADWLKTLARFAVEKSCSEKFGAAGSKVLFFYGYLIAEFSMPGNVSALISDININPDLSTLNPDISIINPGLSSNPDDSKSSGRLKTPGFFLSDVELLKGDMAKSIKYLKNCQPVSGTGKDGKSRANGIRITNGAIIGFPAIFSSINTLIRLTVCSENADGTEENINELKIDIIKYENSSQNQDQSQNIDQDQSQNIDQDQSQNIDQIQSQNQSPNQDQSQYQSLNQSPNQDQSPNQPGPVTSDHSLGEPAVVERKQVFSGLLQSESSIVAIEIPDSDYGFIQRIINSCGLEVNRSFYARDRGANTVDTGRFESDEEVFSPSGSSLFISKKCLEDTGFFESSFFTYYEDMDLFWRARLKGWKMYFVPESVAGHHHCGTGTEWSKTFTYHVLRNRLLAVYRCGWPKLVLRSQAAFMASLILAIAGLIKGFMKGKTPHRPDIIIRVRIFFELFYLLPLHFFKRAKIRKTRVVNEYYIKKWIVDF
jgi:GT2 family glycosyltransferase